jgi:hypothetical protein
MTEKLNIIDLSKWPENKSAPWNFNEKLHIPNVLDRKPLLRRHAVCILHFIWGVCAKNNYSLEVREGSLRAAFFSNEIPGGWEIYKSNNPLYHLIKILRNTQMHLRNITLLADTTNLRYENEEYHKIIGDFDAYIYISQELTLEDLTNFKNKKRYKESDLQEMLDWMNREQRVFGIQNIIFLGLQDFIKNEFYRLEEN